MSLYDRPEPRTAAEARERAAAAIAWRKEQFRRPAPMVEVAPPPPAPKPIPRPVVVALPPKPAPTPEPSPEPIEPPEPAICLSVRAVTLAASAHFGTSHIDLVSGRRSHPLTNERHIMIYVAKIATPFPLTQIAMRLNRDHTTILHSCKRVEKWIAAGSEYAITAVKGIMAHLGIPWDPAAAIGPPPRPRRGMTWTEDEMEHLRRCVLSCRYPMSRLLEEFDRTEGAIITKMQLLGLKLRKSEE